MHNDTKIPSKLHESMVAKRFIEKQEEIFDGEHLGTSCIRNIFGF